LIGAGQELNNNSFCPAKSAQETRKDKL